MEILEYREKWFKDDDLHFRNVQHVALDPDGNWAAFGSKAGLLFATADDGELKVVVRNRGCTITSLLWQVSRGVICGYNDGTTANIFIRKVCPKHQPFVIFCPLTSFFSRMLSSPEFWAPDKPSKS